MRRRKLRQAGAKRARERGLTLIEVTVAVLVLSIGTVAALRAFDAARLQIGGAPERLFAQQVALNRAAEFRALGAEAARGLPETVTYAGRDWQLAVTETETLGGYTELRVQAVGPRGEGALVVGFVGEEEAAG